MDSQMEAVLEGAVKVCKFVKKPFSPNGSLWKGL
jgi:hypothetical protein